MLKTLFYRSQKDQEVTKRINVSLALSDPCPGRMSEKGPETASLMS